MADVFPSLQIPGLPPQGQSCLWQIHRTTSGHREVHLEPPYQCDMALTWRGFAAMLNLPLSIPQPGCSETDVIPDGAILSTRGTILYRKDGLAVYNGSFSIMMPGGGRIFTGRMELFDEIGTHTDVEKCNEERHLEGWLVGVGLDQLQNCALRLSIAGTLVDPIFDSQTQLQGPSGVIKLVLNGVFIKA